MAHSNYKVLTDVDLSNNQLLNVSRIENTEEASKSLFIKTNGDTTLEAANLTGNVATGITSLTTRNSEVTVTNTATETITASKTTTVATTTTEIIDSTGISIKTPSQTVVATASSKVESPSVTLVTGTPEGTGTDKQAKITLTKKAGIDNSAIVTSAKEVTVDANVTGGSITQTAPMSTYRADGGDVNSLKLTTDNVKLKSDTEAITLTKAKDGAAAQTEMHSNNLVVNATTVEVKENTTTSIKASKSVSVGVGSGDPSPTTIGATASDVAIKSNKVTITGRNTTDAIKLVAGSTSVSVLPQQIKLDSDDKLFLESDEGVAINDLKSATITAPTISEKASTRSEVKSPSITLVTGPFADSDSTKQASLALTKTANIDNSKIGISAKEVTVDANVTGGSITQTAPTSTYKTSENNKIVLDSTGITLTNNSEVAKLGNGMTSVAGTRLDVTTTTVNINHTGTNTISANDIRLHTKGNNPASSLDISSGETTLKSPKVTLNGTGSEGVTVKSGDNSSSVAVKSTTVKIDSKGTLDVSANGNISVDNPGFTIDIDTKDVLEKATVSSTVRSPKITLVTGTPEGTGNNKQAKIALTKTANTDDSTINSSAKTVEVTATGSITQTAPTSTYQTTDKDRKISLDSADITLKNRSEIVKLENSQTKISGTKLYVDAGVASINNSTTDITSTDGITAKTDVGSELEILTGGATLKSPEITLNGTGNNGVTIKSGDTNSSSIVIKNTSVNIDSKDTLSISADKGITLSDEKSVGIIAPSISETAANGTIENTAGTITLTTDKLSGVNAGASTLTIDGKNSTLNTGDSTVIAASITQTAPVSVYKADSNNSLELGTGSVKIKSGEEAITLTKSGDAIDANTKINSSDLTITAAKMNVTGNTTTSITSSTSITAKATSGDGTSTITTKPSKIELTSKEALLATSVNKDGKVKNSSIALSPANAESSLALTTDGKLNVTSTSGARVDDGTSLTLTAPKIVETASNSISLSSSNINLQNAETSATKTIALNNTKISIAADNAKVDIAGNNSSTPDTVAVSGAEFKVSSGKSTFTENSKFNKNVEIVGDLTTKNMSGEAATLNSLDVRATTTVNGTLSTGTAIFTSINGADATLKQTLTVEGETTVGEGGATIGTLTVNDGATLTAEAGMTAKKAVTVDGTTKVNGTATVGVLTMPNGETLEAQKGLTSRELVEVTGTTIVSGTATVGNLSVPNGQTFTAEKGVLAKESVTINNTTTASTLDVTGTLAANSGLTSKGPVSIENKNNDPTALTVNNTATTGILTVGGTLKTTTGGVTSAGLVEIVGMSPDGKSLTVNDTATTGILTVGGTLKTTTGGVTSAGLVDILNTSNRDKALTVSDIATTGTLTVAGDLKTTTSGVTSAGLVSIENKKSAATALTISNTATTNTLTVTGDLGAGKGLKSAGLVSIENKKSAATALTVSNTTTTETLTVTGDLSAGKGLKSAGLVDITGESADGKSLTVSGTATAGTLTISESTLEAKGGLTATGKVSVGSLTASTANVNSLSIPSTSTLEATTKMTSGTVTVTGETSIATITGTGSLDIPATLTATNGGTTGSVNVSNIEIKTVMGEGSLEIPPTGTLIADKGGKATTKFEPANIEIKNVMGEGFLKIPETTTLEAVKGGKAKEKFEPANVEIATVTGEGSLTIPSNQTLTAMKGGTINGSMTIGKSNSTNTNLELYGNATIGTSGTSGTTLKSYAKIDAKSTLEVAEKATFSKNAEVAGDFILDGVTIRWDSTLGALTFSKG